MNQTKAWMDNMETLEDLKAKNEAPAWLEDIGFETLQRGYLLKDETPKQMWQRVSKSVAGYLNKPELEVKFFDLLWKNWLGLASPVAANCGTSRGMPISCFAMSVPDNVSDIMYSMHELAAMSKNGGGVAMHWNPVRARGSVISAGGYSDGIIPFIKIQDVTTVGISQGSTRRGASAAYLPVEHGDIDEFLRIRRPEGDPNRQCLNIHHGVTITDEFMRKVESGGKKGRALWKEILRTRFETGEPYIFFTDTVDRTRPEAYKKNNLRVDGSNICTEILLTTDQDHSFVCCLSSLNLARWEEWKDTDAVYLSTWFLDGVLSEFINKAKDLPGFERSVRSAIKGRALGLGVFGWHSLLQSKMLPFDNFDTYQLNAEIFRSIDTESLRATKDLAKEFGEPEWCKGLGIRNTHRVAVAPTVSNSTISGGLSPSIEPWAANTFTQKTAKGTFLRKNSHLEKLLEKKGKNTLEIWSSILKNEGSVSHLDFLTKEEKEVFHTAREINQFVIVKLAAQRYKWIDQAQSLNLFFPVNVSPKYFHEVHMEAWKSGIKTLYYVRTSSGLKGDAGSREYKREIAECSACES